MEEGALATCSGLQNMIGLQGIRKPFKLLLLLLHQTFLAHTPAGAESDLNASMNGA